MIKIIIKSEILKLDYTVSSLNPADGSTYFLRNIHFNIISPVCT